RCLPSICGAQDSATRYALQALTSDRNWALHGMSRAKERLSSEVVADCSLRTQSGTTFCSTARRVFPKAFSLTHRWCALPVDLARSIGPAVPPVWDRTALPFSAILRS